MKQTLSLLLTMLMAAPAPAPAQQPVPKKQPLTVDWIMRGPELYGYAPRAIRWSGDGQQVYFQWKQASDAVEKDYETWVVNRDGSGLKRLTDEEARLAPPAGGFGPAVSESRDERYWVYSDRGDIVILDRKSGKRRQVTKTSEAESNPQFTRDGRRIAFVRGGNLYTLSLEDGSMEQLTDIRAASATAAPAGPPAGFGGGGGGGFRGGGGGAAQSAQSGAAERRGSESQEALKKEERALLEVVERRAKKREDDEAKRKKEESRRPWNLVQRQNVGNMSLSPDETFVLASVMEQAADAKTTVVPNYVSESAYTETIPSRTNVGDSQGRARMAMVNVKTGAVTWLDHGQKERVGDKDVDRQVSLTSAQWSEDGSRLALMGRSADNKDRWVFAVDLATGKLKPLFQEHNDAWIGGPGNNRLGWLADNRTLWFQSERDGWSHIYTVAWEGGEPKQLTSGKWEVETATLTQDKSRFLLTTSEESHAERHLYWMSASGGARTKLTSQPGDYVAALSPDEKAIAVIYSFTNRPPELYLMDAQPGAKMTRVTTSPSAELASYAWQDAPIVQIPARDGAMIAGRLYKPAGWKKGGPAVLFVHGAGYLQNVTRGWSSYGHEYLFHHLLMERGYTVLDIDYRGSAGYGRDWRTGIYRHMGGKDLDDHVDAVRWLVKEHGVDTRRVGLYGGSYGGFITLMAMFTQPDVFAAGAALRPVTDWAHYNHGYTANILNLPQKDKEAYQRSSPIYHAAGLKGALLICHGVVDVNVHFQDTVRLVQKLIELRKENWEAAMYPVEDHSFVQASSWADEYKRILKLFETNLK
ncbi:MAG: S9 family peptidase [Acidobacteria bacterium]|nr:S9 family peptidase [Acidobacteriota bacterium]